MEIPRFYPILDLQTVDACGLRPVDAARSILEAGSRLIQFRHKGPFTRERFEEARQVSELARASGAVLIVNDRVDVAVALDAAVHVGQQDLSPREVRAIAGPSRIVGVSTHNEAQMRAAVLEPVDYVAFGPVFATTSKQNPDPTVGLEQLRAIRRLTRLPLVAIGGITRHAATAVLDAGADSIAVIGDLFTGGDLRASVHEWLRITDSYRN